MGGLVGYVRVSTSEQGFSGAGLEAQRRAIEAEAARRGWELVRIEEDVQSGRSTRRRPGLARALEACSSGEAGGLVATKLDRLTRSLLDFAALLERAQREGWGLVVIEQSFDLGTPHGRAMAGMLAVFAALERDLIGERTRAALAVRRSQGVRLGRPPGLLVPPDLAERIRAMRHEEGMTLQAIADVLNGEGVATPRGGREWRRSSFAGVLQETQR
jgi:DNA invertase Pin-like site-specific DNA recombinase